MSIQATDYTEGFACTDCYTVLHTATRPDDPDPRWDEATAMQTFSDYEITDNSAAGEALDFTLTVSCDICETDLPGARYPIAIWQ